MVHYFRSANHPKWEKIFSKKYIIEYLTGSFRIKVSQYIEVKLLSYFDDFSYFESSCEELVERNSRPPSIHLWNHDLSIDWKMIVGLFFNLPISDHDFKPH